jgi:prophage antirepressor-like protein
MNDLIETQKPLADFEIRELDSQTESFEGKITVAFVDSQGKFWFIAKELESALGLQNVSQALKTIRDDFKFQINKSELTSVEESKYKNILAFFPSTVSSITLVHQKGAYRLAFKGRSEAAVKFSDWVVDVIDTIRETGGYQLPGTLPEGLIVVSQQKFNNLQGDVEFLLEDNLQIKEQLERQDRQIAFLVDTNKGKAGRTPGIYSQTAMDLAKAYIYSGRFDAIIYSGHGRGAKISKLVVDLVLEEFPDSEVNLHPQFVYPHIKARQEYVDARLRSRVAEAMAQMDAEEGKA